MPHALEEASSRESSSRQSSSRHVPLTPRRAKTLTDSELALLGVLWERGPSTVREVVAALPGWREMEYATALKLLQIMHSKGLVERDEAQRAHVYRASKPRESTQRRLVGELLERGFAGSPHDMVLRILESKPCSPEELEEIRALIDRFEESTS